MGLIKLTRQELYDRVWATPTTQLAQELGLSDVAVAKTCRRMQVPSPPRGYWAKLAAGQKLKKPPLPELKVELGQRALAAAVAQKQSKSDSIAPKPADKVPPQRLERLDLPTDNRSLHPVARDLRTALLDASPNQEGMLQVPERPDLPTATASKKSVDSLVRFYSAILSELETRGAEFRKFRGKYGSPALHCGKFHLSITMEEIIETVTREPTEREKRRPSSEWQLSSRGPSGRFQILIQSGDHYNRSGRERVIQKPPTRLDEFAAQIAETIWDSFVTREKDRIEAEARWEREQAERKIEEEKERKKQHHSALAGVATHREENLMRAAQWWRLQNTTADFIDDCERRWRSASNVLSEPQVQWLAWARAHLKAISPIEIGYPDPAADGPFDPAAVPFGGPYPSIRRIPRPPTMPAPPQAQSHSGSSPSYTEARPYPFWLKYQ